MFKFESVKINYFEKKMKRKQKADKTMRYDNSIKQYFFV